MNTAPQNIEQYLTEISKWFDGNNVNTKILYSPIFGTKYLCRFGSEEDAKKFMRLFWRYVGKTIHQIENVTDGEVGICVEDKNKDKFIASVKEIFNRKQLGYTPPQESLKFAISSVAIHKLIRKGKQKEQSVFCRLHGDCLYMSVGSFFAKITVSNELQTDGFFVMDFQKLRQITEPDLMDSLLVFNVQADQYCQKVVITYSTGDFIQNCVQNIYEFPKEKNLLEMRIILSIAAEKSQFWEFLTQRKSTPTKPKIDQETALFNKVLSAQKAYMKASNNLEKDIENALEKLKEMNKEEATESLKQQTRASFMKKKEALRKNYQELSTEFLRTSTNTDLIKKLK